MMNDTNMTQRSKNKKAPHHVGAALSLFFNTLSWLPEQDSNLRHMD